MTPFLLAALVALLAGGGLVVLYREKDPRFRPALAGAAGVVAVVAAYAWWSSHRASLTGDDAVVQLEAVSLTPVAGSYRLQGKARNTSDGRAVSSVIVRLQVDDCGGNPAGTAACAPLATLEQPLALSLPPGQLRDFVLVFNVSPADWRPAPRWQVSAGAARTHAPASR